MHHSEVEIVANKICELFREENILTYYEKPPAKPNAHAGGKLWNKYLNHRTFLKDLRKITVKVEKPKSSYNLEPG